MSAPIFTFSVPEQDTKDLKFVQELKNQCKRTGQSFSFLCLQALKSYKEATNE